MMSNTCTFAFGSFAVKVLLLLQIFRSPAEVEIVNPDLYLFTVDDSHIRLEIDMTVEHGRGYSPANDRSGRLPIGELPVDAIFTPVRRVNLVGKCTRVGQSTNYDTLES